MGTTAAHISATTIRIFDIREKLILLLLSFEPMMVIVEQNKEHLLSSKNPNVDGLCDNPKQPIELKSTSIPIPSFKRLPNLNFQSTPFSKLVLPSSNFMKSTVDIPAKGNTPQPKSEPTTMVEQFTNDITEEEQIFQGMQNIYRLADRENEKYKEREQIKLETTFKKTTVASSNSASITVASLPTIYQQSTKPKLGKGEFMKYLHLPSSERLYTTFNTDDELSQFLPKKNSTK